MTLSMSHCFPALSRILPPAEVRRGHRKIAIPQTRMFVYRAKREPGYRQMAGRSSDAEVAPVVGRCGCIPALFEVSRSIRENEVDQMVLKRGIAFISHVSLSIFFF